MTPEELLLQVRATHQIVRVQEEVVRWYRITLVKHPPPCYNRFCSCFKAEEMVTGEEEEFSYQDLSEYDRLKVQVGTTFLWVEALEENACGSRSRVTHLLFEGEVPTAPPEQPVVSTTSSEEMISRINRYVAAYLRQR